MAEVPGGEGGGGGGRHQKKRAKKGNTRIDMTPMVDLAFLLLTFFILTTTMYKPSTLQLTLPVPPEGPKPPLDKVNNALTVFLTKKDQILYYKDAFKPGETQLSQTNFKDITKLLVDLNKGTLEQINALSEQLNKEKITKVAYDTLTNNIKRKPEALFVIIKPDADAKYRNMIDMVDNMAITGIGKYAVQDTIKPEEQALIDIEKVKF